LLEGMDSEKAEFSLEHNPLYPLLCTWLESGGMAGREWIDSKSLYDELVEQTKLGYKFPYKNAGSLSRALKNLKTDLRSWIEVSGPQKLPGTNNKTFWQVQPGEKYTLSTQKEGEEQDEQVAEVDYYAD